MSNIEVEEHTVTIRTLSVGKKQLTKRIFDQLPQVMVEGLYADPLLLIFRGKIWGWVKLTGKLAGNAPLLVEVEGQLVVCHGWHNVSVDVSDVPGYVGVSWVYEHNAEQTREQWSAVGAANNELLKPYQDAASKQHRLLMATATQIFL